MMSIGERIRELRDRKQLSQSGLAALVGCDGSMISRWERDAVRPRSSTLARLATALDTTTDFLSGRSDDATRQTTPGVRDNMPTTLNEKKPENISASSSGILTYDFNGLHVEMPDTPENRAKFHELIDKTTSMMCNTNVDFLSATPAEIQMPALQSKIA